MKSSSGEHFIALDHVRALAAFMVFTWHFLHGATGSPVPFNSVSAVAPLVLLDEGHTGVALFMTLSGYLFAKLLDGKAINFRAFFWNRALRLLPLLLLVIVIAGFRTVILNHGSVAEYAQSIVAGLIFPTLPNGGWSITVEFQYYLILPAFLWMLRRSRWLPFLIVLSALIVRFGIHGVRGEVQSAAYWTIVGRIDQFALGMLVFGFRDHFTRRHGLVFACLAAFVAFYWYFDHGGGFYNSPIYPSPSLLWVVIPTIEGLAYAIGIAWYETAFSPGKQGLSSFVGRIGNYSYSIYLLHVFFVFRAAQFINDHVMKISNPYVAMAWSLLCFLAMIPLGYLSFRFIEAPFLRLRKRYTIGSAVRPTDRATAKSRVGFQSGT